MAATEVKQHTELQLDAIDATRSAPHEQSFSPFKLLPAELRMQIWALNLLPRLVKVYYDVRIGKFYTTTPSPANLLVCKESRREIVAEWALHFGTRNHPPLIRANLAIDTVQLHWSPLRLQAVSQADLSRILSLEIGGRELQYTDAEVILETVLSMGNLRDLCIVSPAPTVLRPCYPRQSSWRSHTNHAEREHWFVMAERLGYEEKRNQAFRQHGNLTRCFRSHAREHQDRKLPKLCLLLIEADGSRSAPFFCKP